MRIEKYKELSEEEINKVLNQLLYNYQCFDNDVVDLVNFSGLSEKKCIEIVRKRYKDFIIN